MLVIQKELLEKIHGFDSELKSAEDLDFALRAAEITEFGYLKEALACYRRHEDNYTHKYADVGIRECIQITKNYLPHVSSVKVRTGIIMRLAQFYVNLFVLIPFRNKRLRLCGS